MIKKYVLSVVITIFAIMIYKWQNTSDDILDNETWKTCCITGFNISNFGRMKNNGAFVKYGFNSKKKPYLRTYVDSVRFLIHRLVALNFIHNPKPEEYDQVNHLDGDKMNPEASNLEWCNNQLNIIHAVKNGLHVAMKCDKNGSATMCNGKAMAIIRIMATSSLTNREAAKYFQVPYGTLRKIKDGNKWHDLDSYRNIFQ